MDTYRQNKRGSRRRRKNIRHACAVKLTKTGLIILAVLTVILAVRGAFFKDKYVDVSASEPWIDVQLLDINPYSRPGIETDGITGIVIHYTANPGSSAKENRDYFNGLQYTHETEASSNFIVGLDGEIIQCVPTWEVAYASNDRNYDTVSIEVCHPDQTGEFTDKTYESLIRLTAWLCVKFDLTEKDVIRHYDITGKNCPKYFVEHEDAWKKFKENVSLAIASEN